MRISVLINFYNNRREAQNTLYAFTRGYQADSEDLDYEVIALDNGSSSPLLDESVAAFGSEFRHRFVDTASVSPAAALNSAAREASGDYLVVLIDGAHIPSPRMLRTMADACAIEPRSFVATPGFHIGPKTQNFSVLEGYNQDVEDALLASVDWRANGYLLYAISNSFHDGSAGWFGCPYESNCFGIPTADFLQLGGFDERFVSVGGGLVNLDFFQRAVALADLRYFMLLGEASFHQYHGGVASNAPAGDHPWDRFHAEYVALRGRPLERVWRRPTYLGTPPREALAHLRNSAWAGLEHWMNVLASGHPLT